VAGVKNVKLTDGKALIPAVISMQPTSSSIPELIAERTLRFAHGSGAMREEM